MGPHSPLCSSSYCVWCGDVCVCMLCVSASVSLYVCGADVHASLFVC